MAFEQLSYVVAIGAILIAAGISAYAKLAASPDVPLELPWVGLKDGMFSGLRTRIGTLGCLRDMIEDGYRKYSTSGRSFILPGLQNFFIILPQSEVKWIADQPDNVLNAKDMQRESLQTYYTLLEPVIVENPLHENLVRRELTRGLGAQIPDVLDELAAGVDEYWGKNTEGWTDVSVFNVMMKIVSRASNRIFVGLPLCRNEEYLNNAANFAQDIAISSTFLRMLPRALRPLLGWIFVLPNRWHNYKCSKYLIPLIKERLKLMATKPESEPNDFISWLTREVADVPDAGERTPERISLRIMTLNFAAIHTSTFTATNIIFDLFSAPPQEGYVAGIREEITHLLKENNGVWDKNVLAKMVKTDSAIRESLRISTFMSHGMDRMIVAPKGVTMNNGMHLPQGTRLGTATYSIHHDDSVYDHALTYDAFRFSRARETALGNGHGAANGGTSKEDLAKMLESKNLSTVTTSDTFLSFGHGRHACPGRFFAAMEMKLLVGYIVMNYDVEPMAVRPPNSFMGGTVLPPMKAKISVRRRAAGTVA